MTDLEIIQKYSAMVRVLALARTSQPSDADDVYQEVFYRYIDKHPKFKDEEHAKAWFIRVTLNITKNMYTSFYNSKRADIDESQINDLISDDDFMSEVEQNADFERKISLLNPRYRAILMMHFDCGYTVKEISKLLGETELTVKALLVRGKQQYRQIIFGKERQING